MAAQQGKAPKGLPKRTGSPAHGAVRQQSWARGEARHARNRAADEFREERNRAFLRAKAAGFGFAPLIVQEGPHKGRAKSPSEQARYLRRLIIARLSA